MSMLKQLCLWAWCALGVLLGFFVSVSIAVLVIGVFLSIPLPVAIACAAVIALYLLIATIYHQKL